MVASMYTEVKDLLKGNESQIGKKNGAEMSLAFWRIHCAF